MAIDRDKLIKLMMMTQSTNVGEALTAIRKANALLKVEGYDWRGFLSGLSKPATPRPAPPPRQPMRPSGRGTSEVAARSNVPKSRFTDPEIPRMLASLMRDSKGSFRDFVESINEAWEKYGHLTERQYEAVVNAYEREK